MNAANAMTPNVGRKALIAAAGTGGHIMPGLAVAAELRARGWELSWIGTTTGMENDLVPKQSLALDTIAFTGLRGKGLKHSVLGVIRLIAAFFKAFALLRGRQPEVVFGTGGYVCVPVGLVAWLTGRPLVLLNCDAAGLLSNRLLAPFAAAFALGFPDTHNRFKRSAVWTGNPVRAAITALAAPEQRFRDRDGPLRLVVIGGSLGAAVLNNVVPAALALLPAYQRPTVAHQAGARHAEMVKIAYAQHDLDAEVMPFIDDIAAHYQRADLVICRAGAITVAELCAAGVPAILVPLRLSTTDHQTANAVLLADAAAGLHIPQIEFTAERLAQTLAGLDRARLLAMAVQARRLSKPHAARAVADLIELAAA